MTTLRQLRLKNAHFLDIPMSWMDCTIQYDAHIRTWGYEVFGSLKKGVWRYLILKDVEQKSLTSLAYYIGNRAVRPHIVKQTCQKSSE